MNLRVFIIKSIKIIKMQQQKFNIHDRLLASLTSLEQED